LTPREVHQQLTAERIVLVDVRSPEDQLKGISQGALMMTEHELLAQRNQLITSADCVVLMCYRGNRSGALSQQLGKGFVSAEGGFAAWQQAGLPIDIPATDLARVRYQQPMKLDEFGTTGQQRLRQAHVLVVGAGGLGAPALLYLAGAGVGNLTIVDGDEVSLSNLHRQIIYTERDVGASKVNQAAKRLMALNSEIRIHAVNEYLNVDNAQRLIGDADLVIDGTDNVNTRYLINDTCLVSQTPWIYAAVTGFEMQLALFSQAADEPCYRCVFSDLSDADAANCSQEGVLGPVPGMAAMIQVTEAIKWLVGMATPLSDGLLTYNLLNHQAKVLKYPPNQRCTHKKQ